MDWYWNSISINEPYIMPWINEEPKLNSHISMPLLFGELIFRKRVGYY